MHFAVAISLLGSVSFVAVQGLGLPIISQSRIQMLLSDLGPVDENDPRFKEHYPPGPWDVRSPCPGLNTLANHNFIHHAGKSLTIPHLIKGLSEGLNMGPDFTLLIGATGLLASGNPLLGYFNLDDLNQHNFPTEHDVSISRSDANLGDAVNFNETVWNHYMSFFNGKQTTDVSTAAQARYSRFSDSQKNNPQLVFGPKEQVLSLAENALLLQTMSDPLSGRANLDYVRTFIQEEKLPFAQGWRPSKTPITLASLGLMSIELLAKSPNIPSEVVQVTKDSYKDVLIAAIGGKEILKTITQGISDFLGF